MVKKFVENAIHPIVLKRVGVDQAGEVTGMMLNTAPRPRNRFAALSVYSDYEHDSDFTSLLTDMDYFDKLVFEAYQTHN